MFEDFIPYLGIRPAAILTNAYVPATAINCQLNNQLVVFVNFTKGSLDSLEIKLEFSYDGTNYFQETFEDITTGTSVGSLGIHQYTASGAYIIDRKIMYRWVRISAHGTGTVTSSSLALDAFIGVV